MTNPNSVRLTELIRIKYAIKQVLEQELSEETRKEIQDRFDLVQSEIDRIEHETLVA